LCAVLGSAGAATLPLTEDFETRFETHHNITPEQTAAGQGPHFKVEAEEEDGAQILSIAGDEKGICTGYLYVGRRVQVPERVPLKATVRLAFRRECTHAERAPALRVRLFTLDGWESLPADPQNAEAMRRFGRREVLRTATIVSGREDTLEWTPWESPNLASALRHERGREVVVALSMAAMHTGATEWAQFRSPELVMEDMEPELVSRTPKYPPKEHRTLHSDEEVALARSRCDSDRGAQSIREGVAKSCAFWMGKSDDEIRAIIPPADVPRAFNVSTQGCPVHGKAIYRKGTYPWRLNIDKPFKITCPIGGEEYPSNDFWAYYRSGFKDQSALEGKYADDGWGWKGSSGDLYWLVGYGCHWYWAKYIKPGVVNLSRAYLLTGDVHYAHKAAVMLDRIADLYPSMQYEYQSRYGFETGGRYHGKILNHIWETGTVRTLAEAYDNIFDALEDGSALEGQLAKSCGETRANIEANILEEAIECVQDRRVSGNFGMHQCALAMTAIVRETGPTKELLDWILKQSGKSSYSHEGIDYAFYNLIYKDGMPYETSPGYCFGWVGNFVSLARVLEKAGYDFYEQPKFKAMLDAFLDLVCVGKYTPAIGDAGSLTSGWIGGSLPVYAAGFAHYRDVRYAHALRRLGALGSVGFRGYEGLFEPEVLREAKETAAAQPEPTAKSRVLDGYGIGILNNADNSVAASIYYGFKGGHGHFDRLNFSLFAYGQKMTPDLGYPDFMNALVPGIFSWSKNTVSHNCVVVNRQRQMHNLPGRVQAFLDTPEVRFIDVAADETYAEASVYRRALLLIDLAPDSAYLLDLSTVCGGEQHDYSVHGPLGTFEVVGGELSRPQEQGTLAGEGVPYGHFYDDPVLGEPKYRGSFGGYRGSGFQHLENVQRLSPGSWWAQWQLDGAEDIGLRLRILDQPGQELFVTDGRVSPTGKKPWVLKYLIARRQGRDVKSQYVSLLEPFRREPFVRDVRRVEVEGAEPDSCYAIEVERRGGVDVIVYQRTPRDVTVPDAQLRTDAALCVARLTPERRLTSVCVMNGSHTQIGDHEITTGPAFQGTVASVDYSERAVRLRLADERALPTDETLAGKPIIFSNEEHTSFYTIRSVARGDGELVVALKEPEIMTGKAQVTEVRGEAKEIRTGSQFAFPAIYPGMRVVNEGRSVSIPVDSLRRGVIRLTAQCSPEDFSDGDGDGVVDAWLCDFGPGDAFRIDSVVALAKRQ